MQLCLAPLQEIAPAGFELPANACDTHAHVVSDDTNTYPFVANRSYTPPAAPESNYLSMLERTGMQRGVLIQISVYGDDNRYMLKVLQRHPDKLRGIAVVREDVTQTQLQQMHEAGVRGLRLNVLFGGGTGFDAMETLAGKIAEFGWHMQFLMDARQLPELLPRLKRLPVPGVIDHMGHMPVAESINHPGFRAMQELIEKHDWWVKLSGAYRISDDFPDFADVVPWAQALINTNENRMLWGSDWPHVSIPRMPNTGLLLAQLAKWAPESRQRNKILVDNPAALYGFKA
ncbi:amidohydrolase family protein [Advenella mimigardefordensis]|uniref:Putative amidohydrolase 2 n=1 Tax=Advenella mimigardefordensis (strain DSM 17166 / LMG 22922 / DPN7) TaxID=1247726 RepID=W0PAE0_ADVMD|nr:amidohydrolase family protein [Advenella mimigardefordensis]AHG63809.1 putative amidohydrolase 2 [Advenella mimigardefordensis DPN7]